MDLYLRIIFTHLVCLNHRAAESRSSKPPSSICGCGINFRLRLVLASQVNNGVKSVGRERLGGHLLRGRGEELLDDLSAFVKIVAKSKF